MNAPVAPLFVKDFPHQKDLLALPVSDLDAASRWYCSGFGGLCYYFHAPLELSR
jgi:hypothetical protein